MISTYLGYMIASKDMTTTLSRVAAQAATKREADYYNTHIGNVKNVDDFIGDYRLYTYAMKAYGLEDMTYAKAFMRKVLTEGAGSAASFANRLADERYVAFASAFNFAATVSATGTDATEFGKAGGRAGITAPAALAET